MKEVKNTLVINFIGGQGAGKSTMASSVFSYLKWRNINCELCTEFAKDLVYENRQETFKDEMYIFAKQNHKLVRCIEKVNLILTDRPLIMSVVYNQFYGNPNNKVWNESYEKLVIDTFNSYDNINIFLNRVKPYDPNGRNETEAQAREFDKLFKQYLDDNNYPYYIFDGCEEQVKDVGEMILKI